ncbi:MAG: flavodoxin family protein [Thermodesulfobacteriota bacterium]|nr:flavodoxin family protein [Thermodesulfobacteriota bacterium]
MKVLVVYFSQTGNTEQIAKAIHQEASQSNESRLSKVEETKADSLNEYDLLFVGSPIHARGIAGPVKELLDAIVEPPKFKLSLFVTHSAFAYETERFDQGISSVEEICKSKKIAFLGSYDCQGRLSPDLQPIVKQSRGLSDEEWAERMAKADEHPNAEDEQKAREFAKSLLI